MPIETIVESAAALVKTVTGINDAYPVFPPSVESPPVVVFGIDGADIVREGGANRFIRHRIRMTVLVGEQAGQDRAEELARPYVLPILDKFDLSGRTLSGSCLSSEITGYEYGVATVGQQEYLGVTFSLVALERHVRTFGG